MNPFELIEYWGIPTTNSIDAVAAIHNHDPESGRKFTEDLTEEEMVDRIRQLTQRKEVGPFDSPKHTRLIYGYAVSIGVELFEANSSPTKTALADYYDTVLIKTGKLIRKSPWSVMTWETEPDGEPKMDAAGNPKQKKGAKKEMALKVYAENKDKDLSRQEWIALLMEEVGMTKAGASTYYANLKKGNL